MYIVLLLSLFFAECFAQDIVSQARDVQRKMQSLAHIAAQRLLSHHRTLEHEHENADAYFEYYQTLSEEKDILDSTKIVLAQCIITSRDIEKINTFNKKVPSCAYPQLAYHIFSGHLKAPEKQSAVDFLLNQELEQNTRTILEFLIHYHRSSHKYFTERLLCACENKVEPYVFQFLLESGDEPLDLVIWHLIGNKKPAPEIHERMLEKLAYLTSLPIIIQKSPPDPFAHGIPIKPLQYVEAMLECWQDTQWTRGVYKEKIEQGVVLKLGTRVSQEAIQQYISFYQRVRELLKISKNIMPS